MDFEISSDVFWKIFEDFVKKHYKYNLYHISNMKKLLNYIEADYEKTFIKDQTHYFKFKINNKKSFFLAKIKHGI